MIIPKKSLGQNFLIDKNICKKISKISNVYNKNILEIGPGMGAITDEIIKLKPKKLIIIEKDIDLFKKLRIKYKKIKNIKIINIKDKLKFKINFEKISILFQYNLNSEKRIHKINSTNLITKKDILSKMIKDVLNEKVDFEDNKNRSLFANKLRDKVIKKI